MSGRKTKEADTRKHSPVGTPLKKKELLDQTRYLSALLAVSETATQSLDTEKILNETLDKSLGILGFEVGFIRTLDLERKNLLVRTARGLSSPEFFANPVPLDPPGGNAAKIIFDTGEPYVTQDIRKDPNFGRRFMVREGIVSVAMVPIMSKKRFIGIMGLASRKLYSFSKQEIDLLEAFGSQLGAALENAHLFDQINRDKAYIENLVENAGDAVVSTGMDDRILTWNRAAEIIFGYSKDEAIGQSLAILLPPDRLKELDEVRNKVELTGVIRNLEVRRKRKDGVMINVALAVSSTTDQDGNIMGFLYIAKDITEKQRYERRIRELDKMKSDFVSNVSHELRTPLTAIKGSVDNMLDGLTGELNEKQVRYLTRIKSNTDRLARLINDILDLSRIEAGKIDLRPTLLPVVSLIKEIAESLRPIALEKLISLEVTSFDASVAAWADRDKITQVLMNLIGNALKFTPAHGTVSVAIDKNGDGWVQISVADTGPGIPPDEANKIFDKFYQVGQANKQKAKGTGLGLAISRALVEMHGGKIWVASKSSGSTFSFTLPAQQPFKIQVPAG